MIYVIYMNMIFEHKFEEERTQYMIVIDNVFKVLLAGFATHFLLNEAKQIIDNGVAYLTSIWNYIDLTGALGVYTLLIFSFFKTE